MQLLSRVMKSIVISPYGNIRKIRKILLLSTASYQITSQVPGCQMDLFKILEENGKETKKYWNSAP